MLTVEHQYRDADHRRQAGYQPTHHGESAGVHKAYNRNHQPRDNLEKE